MEDPKNTAIGKKALKKENWTVVGYGVNYPGHKSEADAKKYAKAKGIPESNVRRLKDL